MIWMGVKSITIVRRRISSLTVGQLRSLQMSEFGTYHGASTIMPKTLDWNRSRISMLEVEAVPQSCIPQVQMGLSMVL
jgi:hypothetical protein